MREKLNKKMIKNILLIIVLAICGYHCYGHYMVSKFYKCVRKGNTYEIIDCIEKMPDVNMLDVCIPLYKIRGIMLQNAANNGYPLYYAVWMQADISVMEALFERGADPNKKDYDTPFRCLLRRRQKDMYEKVKLFVENGADINIDVFRLPDFEQLSENKKEECMKTIIYLWESGLDEWESVGSKYERTILHDAAECVGADYLEILYENEKRPMYGLLNEKDADGETPLFYAVRRGKFDNCRFLIEKGADISIQNNEGKTAYDVAVELGYEECIKILESEIR